MAKKEFYFRGKTLAELNGMGNEDFALLLRAKDRRSLKRGVNKPIDKKIKEFGSLKAEEKAKKVIRTHDRNAVITPKMIGLKIGVHTGKEFQPVEIQQEMLGHRLGEFALSRKKLMHGKAGIGATRSSTAITARG